MIRNKSKIFLSVGAAAFLLAWVFFNLGLIKSSRKPESVRSYQNWYRTFEERALLMLSADSQESTIQADQVLSSVSISIYDTLYSPSVSYTAKATDSINDSTKSPRIIGPAKNQDQLKKLLRLLELANESEVFRNSETREAPVQIKITSVISSKTPSKTDQTKIFSAYVTKKEIKDNTALQLLLSLFYAYSSSKV